MNRILYLIRHIKFNIYSKRTTCLDRVVDNATFTFQAKETFTPSFIGTGQQTAFGDINGDGHDDIIWQALTSSANAVAYRYGTATGLSPWNQ